MWSSGKLIWNISENKVDFQYFLNISDKVKYLGPNLSILLCLNIYFKIQLFANNRFKSSENTKLPIFFRLFLF